MEAKKKNLFLEIGKINTLEVLRIIDHGLIMQTIDESEVLLPNAYVDKAKMSVGSLLDLFIYTDSEDRPVATTQMPYAMLDGYGYFEVVDYKSYGAFVNWGLPKDLFVPLSQQKEYFNIGKKYILKICLDKETGRLYGTQKIGKHLSRDTQSLQPKQEMDLLIIAKTPLGYKVVAQSLYEGMLFDNEIFEELAIGESKKGYIKTIRKDGKLDLTLRPYGQKAKSKDATQHILSALQENGGSLPFTYKSDAEDIVKKFGISKKNYKRALTQLIDAKKIVLQSESIELA